MRELFQLYATLGLPVRLLIGAGVTLLAGTGLGFFAEYAAYSWAAYYGMRPPLEGIPYLKVAVTVLTVVVLVGGAFAFLMANAIAHLLLRSVDDRFRENLLTNALLNMALPHLRNFSVQAALATSLAIGMIFGTLYYFTTYYISDASTSIMEAIAISLMAFIVTLMMWDKKSARYLALFCVVVVIVGVPFSFFHVDVYSKILQGLGYGGGLPVQITIAGETLPQNQRTTLSGHMMLRTTSAILLYEVPSKRIREIPLQQVLFLDHQAVPLSARQPKLPN